MENTYQTLLKKLNQAQKEAVETIEGPVMVIAGPGTGKTQILTLRIAQILEKTQINPQNILALTFSESAAFEMRKRLADLIGTPAFRVEISTFHSFCNDIIKNYPESFPNLLSFESITEVEQIELIEKIISETELLLLKPFGEPLHYVREILSSINDLKKEGVVCVQLQKANQKQKEDFEKIDDLYHEKGKYTGEMKGKYQLLKKYIQKMEEFAKVYASYEHVLQKEKKYDFNDMLLGVVTELENNKELLLQIQEKYQYILVDEHQDTNATQNTLLELLANFHEIPNLFVVGDEKQAIYRFQGASLENFLYFQKLYPSAKIIYLNQNYRSQQHILDAAAGMIENNVSANILPGKKKLQANVLYKLEKIKVVGVPHFFDEYSYIAANITEKIQSGIPLSEIAILGRRNSDLLEISRVLQRNAISFVMDADQDIFSDIHVQKLLLLFSTIAAIGDDVLLAKTMHIDFLGIAPLDVYKLVQFAKQEKKALFDVLSNHKNLILDTEEKIQAFASVLSVWKTASENMPLDDFFIQVLNDSGFRNYMLTVSTRYQTIEKVTGLFQEIKLRSAKNPDFGLSDLLSLVATLKKHNVTLKATTHHTKEEGVRLLTVHKSKGLEFDIVYILNCFDGRWGSIKKRGKSIKIPWEYLGESRKVAVDFAEIEDERRLFYVGLTRARKEVVLTYALQGMDGKEQLPSQFIEEIDTAFIQSIDTIKLQAYFEKEREKIFDTVTDHGIDAKEKAYLRAVFLEKGMSPTSLDNFLKCPWQFFYRNLIALPETKNLNLIFGSAIHKALEYYIKHKSEKDFTIEKVMYVFDQYLQKENISETDRKNLFKKGKESLPGYITNETTTWSEKITSELVIRGVTLTDEIHINGRLDVTEYIDDTHLRVHDFKTGKPKSRSQIDDSKENSKYHYLRQLVFYKLLIEKYYDNKIKMTEGVIDFVEPDEKGQYHIESFAITTEQVEKLKNVLEGVALQILNFTFWDSTCDDEDCEYCRLRSYMK